MTKIDMFRIQKALFLAVALLVLAGVFFDGRSALAQTASLPDWAQPCGPTPADVDFDALPPSSTAQQAAADPGLLDDFALAARGQFEQTDVSPEASLYIGCLLRQPESPWYSGSTYLVTLTVDGRVFVHAKDMSLSGRQLNPVIYGTILSALGVPQTVLVDLASTDPVVARQAIGAVLGILSQRPDAPFDATVPIPGVRPGIPGASGYATVFLSRNFRVPIVQIAGFDLNASHLIDEPIDYGDPAITARDVVDRRTLKAFVTQAGEYVLRLQMSGNVADSSKARIALRDSNGPWRHGNVYLYILDLTSNVILFHGANPDRYELRPLIPRQRDVVTGELILQQVLDAAKGSPEGGFVEYYLDDPTDDTDRADIPKVGYAREFFSDIPGSETRLNFVIGSGFYRSSPNVVTARRNTAVKTMLPQVMRAMTASTVDAVSGRIQQATSDAAPAKGFTLGGASKFSDVLLTNARALQNGTFGLGRLLAGSSFTLPLNARGARGLLGNLAFWGGGDYRKFSGGKPETMDYDGNVLSANLGVDTRLSEDLLAGLSLAWARGTVDYSASGAKGESETTVTSVNPYVGWQSPGGMNLWATAGYGWGEVEIDDSWGTQASDLTQRMVAAGVNGLLMSSDEAIGGGTTSLRVKGETAFSWADIEGSGTLEETTLSASRQRLMLEGAHERKLDSGATFTPSVEVGMRYDGGDGDTGGSVETGGGLRFADTASGLTVEGRARTLFAHSGDYKEWGLSGLVRLDPGEADLGFAVSLQPAWGRTAGGVERLWNTGITGLAADDQTGRVHARIAYGFGTSWGGRGVLTPYSDLSLSGAGSRRFSVGGQFAMGSSVRMSLEGVHSNPVRGGANHGVMLSGHLNW